MNTQKAWASHSNTIDHLRYDANRGPQRDVGRDPNSNPAVDAGLDQQPWASPRTVIQNNERDCYELLKDRLARIPSRTKQKRQTLYIDLWTGQHWLGITLTYPEGYEILKPVSVDTALSIATIGNYRLLNQPLFDERSTGN